MKGNYACFLLFVRLESIYMFKKQYQNECSLLYTKKRYIFKTITSYNQLVLNLVMRFSYGQKKNVTSLPHYLPQLNKVTV